MSLSLLSVGHVFLDKSLTHFEPSLLIDEMGIIKPPCKVSARIKNARIPRIDPET